MKTRVTNDIEYRVAKDKGEPESLEAEANFNARQALGQNPGA